jgi:hypothetical protein
MAIVKVSATVLVALLVGRLAGVTDGFGGARGAGGYGPVSDSQRALDAPGLTRTVVEGRVFGRSGPTFLIRLERSRRGHLRMFAGVPERRYKLPSENSGSFGVETKEDRILRTEVFLGCTEDRTYAIVVGVLRSKNDTVIAYYPNRVKGKSLVKKAIPEVFHFRGELVYASLPEMPARLAVDARNGRIVSRINYEGLGRERCPHNTIVGEIG